MSRTITVHAVARKGAAHRALKRAVEDTLGRMNGECPEQLRKAIEAARVAAYKLIPLAGRSDQLEIQLHAQESPLGGWDVSVMVDNPRPTFSQS